MVGYSLKLVVDRLPPKARLLLPAVQRVVYVREGSATLRADGVTASLAENSALHGRTGLEVVTGASGAQCLRWELTAADASASSPDPSSSGISETLLDQTVQLDPTSGYLLRCDRVDFPPGGVAHLHTHQGPGIRCLLRGSLRVETAGHVHDIAPGGAWFESGTDPVLATASEHEASGFARLMVLPVGLRGQSSIRYVRPEDLDKPKPQRYQVFIDEPIDLAVPV
jgi:quercetin dioxygenase-like cupin family protein